MKLATLCYVKRDGRTLMLLRNKKADDIHAGKWNGLGGKFAPGETPEACAVREIFEESGLVARNPELRGVLTFPAFDGEEDWYAFVFVVRDFAGEIVESAEGDLHWIDDNELLDLNLWEGDHHFIQWLDRPGIFSGRFDYVDGRLVAHDVIVYQGGVVQTVDEQS